MPPARLAECNILVIGVGAIGRQVAQQLAALGAPRVILFDDDTVAVENLAPQGYWPGDLGWKKVDATAQLCSNIYPEGTTSCVAERFGRSTLREQPPFQGSTIVFCCVDSITTRKLIWEAVRHDVALFVDGRMASEIIRVLASDDPLLDSYYETTLFSAAEAYVGVCTARSTIYTASIAAGLMMHQFTRWLRRIPTEPDTLLNLLASEIMIGGSRRSAETEG